MMTVWRDEERPTEPKAVCAGLPPGKTRWSWEGPLLASAAEISRERPALLTHVLEQAGQAPLLLAFREPDGGWRPGC